MRRFEKSEEHDVSMGKALGDLDASQTCYNRAEFESLKPQEGTLSNQSDCNFRPIKLQLFNQSDRSFSDYAPYYIVDSRCAFRLNIVIKYGSRCRGVKSFFRQLASVELVTGYTTTQVVRLIEIIASFQTLR